MQSKPTQASEGIKPGAGHKCYLVICWTSDTVHSVGIKKYKKCTAFLIPVLWFLKNGHSKTE